MTDDLKFHIEGIRAKFKEIFSGGVTYSSEGGKNVEKSNDILKGKNDVNKNFDWSVCGNDLDSFQLDIICYVGDHNISEEDIIKLIDEHNAVINAIDNFWNVVNKVNKEVLNLGQKTWPAEFRNFIPSIINCASWVGYDLDG